MIYIGDGDTDVTAMAVNNKYGGTSFGVYDPNDESQRKIAHGLLDDKRVKGIFPADYTQSSPLYCALKKEVLMKCRDNL